MADLPSASSAVDEKTLAKPALGGEKVYVIEKTFDLDDLLSTIAVDADVINLMNIPAKTMVLAASLETTVIQVGGTGTCTIALGACGTALVAATNISAATYADMANAAAPVGCATAGYLEATLAIGGAAMTTQPTIKVRLACIDCS